jgi:hypothetical protein
VTIDGADETPEHLIEQRTLQLAKGLGVDVSQAQLLHVDARNIDPDKQYRVDPGKRCLIALERPAAHGKSPGSRPSQCGN